MSDARKAVIWLATLVAVVFAGDRLLSLLLDRALLHSEFRYSRLYRGGTNADVVILGDSRGVHSFYAPEITSATGLRTFNLSYSGMATKIQEALLLDYLDHNRAPRLVILEVTSTSFNDGLVPELHTYGRFSRRMEALYAAEDPRGAKVGNLFHLFRLNSGFYLESLHYMWRSDQDWIGRATMPEALRRSPRPYWLIRRRENLAVLNRIVQELRRRSIDYRLVVAPYSPPPRGTADLARAVEAATGARVWNYCNAITNQDLFQDRVHLNLDGSRSLLQLMTRDGLFAPFATGAAAPRWSAASPVDRDSTLR